MESHFISDHIIKCANGYFYSIDIYFLGYVKTQYFYDLLTINPVQTFVFN